MSDISNAVRSPGQRRSNKVRQAVVIVHGMGEQRPLDALTQFVKAALPVPVQNAEARPFYSRPDLMTESYESRVFLAPPIKDEAGNVVRTQTEFYEYHWAHLMQGNTFSDMLPTFKRLMFQRPFRVPKGLKVVWFLFWALLAFIGGVIAGTDWGVVEGGLSPGSVIEAVLGGGFVGWIVTFLVTRLAPKSITKSFVDVVRYLDTSPRSYAVRADIRKGFLDLLIKLHNTGNYQRIVIVAHSLGGYIAYDGITYLWAHMNKLHRGTPARGDANVPAGLDELEGAASDLPDDVRDGGVLGGDEFVENYQAAQRALWLGLRAQGNPWLITDFITLGTPMYFADRLFTKNLDAFKAKVARWELPTCPPQDEGDPDNNVFGHDRWFSWESRGRRVLYHGAPFAAVRWTNMYFPAAGRFFGDWFGERLAPLWGNGIRDVTLEGNRRMRRWFRSRFVPGYAHALYLKFPEDVADDSVTTILRSTIDYASAEWLQVTLGAPPFDSRTS